MADKATTTKPQPTVTAVPIRASRKTEATYAITDAPASRFYTSEAFPFEARLTWYDGQLASGVELYGWKAKKDGTAGRVSISRFVSSQDFPDWLATFVAQVSEPIAESTKS